MGRLFLVIGCVMAVGLIVDSAMHDPDVSPVVDRLFDRVDRGIDSIEAEFGAADTSKDTCRSANRYWRQLDLDLPSGSVEVGHIVTSSDDGIAALLVVTRIDEGGFPTRVDLSTSLNLTGVFTRAENASRFRSITPPATKVKRLSSPGVAAITQISACYTTDPDEVLPTFEATERATPFISAPVSTPVPSESSTNTQEPTTTATISPTVTKTLEAGDTETPFPSATDTTVPTETATAMSVDTETATATSLDTPTAESTSTITATATQAVVPTDTATVTQAVMPTAAVTPTQPVMPTAVVILPTATVPATATVIPTAPPIFQADDKTGFAEWSVPDTWIAAETLSTDGTSDETGWVLPPFTVDSTYDYAVEIHFQIGESNTCPRSFGIAVRGTDEGYYAGGIEWDCDSQAVIWIGQSERTEVPIQIDTNVHSLRIQVVGSEIVVLVDGQVAVVANDDTYQTGTEIGLWSSGVQITITSFAVFDLTSTEGNAGVRHENR